MEAFLWKGSLCTTVLTDWIDGHCCTGRCRIIEQTKGTLSKITVQLEDSSTGVSISHLAYITKLT
jgi:hypothetical protein